MDTSTQSVQYTLIQQDGIDVSYDNGRCQSFECKKDHASLNNAVGEHPREHSVEAPVTVSVAALVNVETQEEFLSDGPPARLLSM